MRVLVVDDEPLIADGLAMLLEEEGLEASVLYEGRDVLRVVAAWRPEVLVLDVKLPDGDGVAIAQDVRRAWPAILIILMSGVVDPSRLRDRSDPRTLWLQKPFRVATLVNVIKSLMSD